MKKIPCNYEGCNKRRKHYTIQDEDRPTQMVEVNDDYESPAYCSITCAIMDGKMTVTEGPREEVNITNS